MSNSVVIGPLPQSINIAKVRQVFSPFITDKIILKKDKAYIRFTDPNDIESLDMKYPGLTIPQLGNAQIDLVPEDFNWILIDSQEPLKKQVTTQEFIMSQKKQQPKPIKINPKFIVVTECDQKLIESTSQDYLRKKLFSKYKLGRIIKYKTDLYVEFLDENQIETLQISFPGLQVRDLGSRATIGLTDESFRYQLIKDQVSKYQMERKLEAEREEKLRMEKKREEMQREQIKREQQKRMKSEEYYSSGSWSVRPEVERESLLNIQKKSGNIELFWALVMVIWGVYVIFM